MMLMLASVVRHRPGATPVPRKGKAATHGPGLAAMTPTAFFAQNPLSARLCLPKTLLDDTLNQNETLFPSLSSSHHPPDESRLDSLSLTLCFYYTFPSQSLSLHTQPPFCLYQAGWFFFLSVCHPRRKQPPSPFFRHCVQIPSRLDHRLTRTQPHLQLCTYIRIFTLRI